tara:strand:+ start:3725 stop:4435 length:711 start_codon:yes stop_codon:yes gene_type:complete
LDQHVPPFRNHLLGALSPSDRLLLGPLEPVDLPLRCTLELPDTPIDAVYFIEQGVASVVSQTAGRREIEVGLIGPEGMSGISLLGADDRSPFETFMQVEGSGFRMPAGQLVTAMGQSDTLNRALMRYARAFHIQVAATSVSNGYAKLEQRLARWLLMVADRVGDSFHITHAFLATMLAVRRAGVTLALQVLEGRGLIRSSRGNVIILNRAGLIAASNGAYGLAEREQTRLLEARES